MFKKSRLFGLIIMLFIYALAVVIGIIIFISFHGLSLIPGLFAADIAATLFVWIAGLFLKNSSVYDPYWSVAPVIMIPLVVAYSNISNCGILLLVVVILFWGIRLTIHWGFTFKNLESQDWRYTKLKDEKPKFWFIINLFGIHIFPTIVVFSVMIPAFLFIMKFSQLNIEIVLSACLSIFAVMLQMISDSQMRRFRKVIANAGAVNRNGLWKYIRHPNYLGEILMWWGVYFMMLSESLSLWTAMIGPLVNTLMFIFISIPLMEGRQSSNKPAYIEYKASTGMLFPMHFLPLIFRHQRKNNIEA